MAAWIFSRLVILACVFVNTCALYRLTILHTNDVHSRIDQTNKYGAKCHSSDDRDCYGGVARLKTKVDEMRNRDPNVLLLDAGDQFQGTPWYTHYSGNASSHFMNLVGYEVMTLGNHEFDNGAEALAPFLKSVEFPVVSCNIDSEREPAIRGLYKKSVTVEVGGQKIGVVGYITTEVPILTNPVGVKNLKFNDEVSAIQQEVDTFRDQGINKIIALGHAGYKRDLALARQVTGVDIFIGGHTHTFMYSGEPPSNEKPTDVYPMNVTSPDGASVLIVQAASLGKYLGHITIEFDQSGQVTNWQGNPILLDGSVTQDSAVLAEVQSWMRPLLELEQKKIGETYSHLDGERRSCRLRECTMGNLLTDALLYGSLRPPDHEGSWSNFSIAVWNGGGIRASLPPGDITAGDVIKVCPFRNSVELVYMTGHRIWEMLDRSARTRDEDQLPGGFLQFSGIKVTYSLDEMQVARVHEVLVRCSECPAPEYRPLEVDREYGVLVSSFLLRGGDGYSVFLQGNGTRVLYLGMVASLLLDEYLSTRSPLIHGLEGRIQFVELESGSGETDGGNETKVHVEGGGEEGGKDSKEEGEKEGEKEVENQWEKDGNMTETENTMECPICPNITFTCPQPTTVVQQVSQSAIQFHNYWFYLTSFFVILSRAL